MREKSLFLITVLAVCINCMNVFASTQRFSTCTYDSNRNKKETVEIEVDEFFDLEDDGELFIKENKETTIEVQEFILNNANNDECFLVLDMKTRNEENPYQEIMPFELELSGKYATNSNKSLGTNYRLIYFDDNKTAINMSENIIRSDRRGMLCSIEKLGIYVIYYNPCIYNIRFYSELPSHDSDGNMIEPEYALYYEMLDLQYDDIIEIPSIPQKDGYVFTGWKTFPSVFGGVGYIKFANPQPLKVYGDENYYASWCPIEEYEPIKIEISSEEDITKGQEDGKKITLKTNYGIFSDEEELNAEPEYWNIIGSDDLVIDSVTRIDDKTVELMLSGNSEDIYKSSDIQIEFDSCLLQWEKYDEDENLIYEEDEFIQMDEDGVKARMYRSDNSIKLSKQSRPGGNGGLGVPKYTVTFKTNGAGEIPKQTLNKNTLAKMPESPQKENYVFSGWYSDEELTQEFDFSEKVTKNITLFAKWEEADKTKDQIVLAVGKTGAVVFGEEKENDVAPVIYGDRAFLPARFVAENLGALVEWNGEKQEVTITKDDVKIIITIGKNTVVINDEMVELEGPAFIENDRTYTPIRFIAEKLGCDVDWNPDGGIITITK